MFSKIEIEDILKNFHKLFFVPFGKMQKVINRVFQKMK